MASKKKMKPEMNSNPSLSSSSDVIGKVVVAVDRISNLPDCINAIILSQLPVEESARTSVLSKQWRRQWLLSPIYIDDKSLFGICDNLTSSEEEFISLCVQTITHILTLHPGPIRFCRFAYSFWVRHCLTLTRLLQTLTQKGIRQLKICMQDGFFDLPCCVLQCEALLDLHLEFTKFPEHLPKRIFPNLKRLHMWSTDIEHHTLSDLLSRSSITDLEIADCDLKQVIIESNSLKRLTVPDTWLMEKLVIRDGPNLERLIIGYLMIEDLELTILNAPKLRALDCISVNISSLRLGESQFDLTDNLIKFSSFSTHFHSLTTLAIRVHFSFVNQGKSIPYLLRCFPCLESLEVMTEYMWIGDINPSPCYGDYWEQHFDIDCLDHHLKYVHLEGYFGKQSHVDFANFIISKARVLKIMTLICGSKWEEQWVETQKQRLLLGNRASPVAQVVFGKTRRFQQRL